jgi:hypothetical protein
MRDAKQNPAAKTNSKPQNQIGEEKGQVKRPLAEERMERYNVAAGSAGDRRRASKGAR